MIYIKCEYRTKLVDLTIWNYLVNYKTEMPMPF